MADHCGICDTRRPDGGTKHLVLNDGDLWIEFCASCGEETMLTNDETGETISVQALYDRCKTNNEEIH